jgi:hypothetical protein
VAVVGVPVVVGSPTPRDNDEEETEGAPESTTDCSSVGCAAGGAGKNGVWQARRRRLPDAGAGADGSAAAHHVRAYGRNVRCVLACGTMSS